MNPNIKKILIIVGVLIISFVLFMLLKGDGKNDELLTVETNSSIPGQNAASDAASIVGVEIIQALNQINALNLDKTIFERPVYISLIDRSQEIPEEPIGRPNPFAPIGRDGGNVNRTVVTPDTTTTATTTTTN